jgi:hypothetical protein
MKSTFATNSNIEDQQRAAARLTRRAVIAYAVVEAVMIFGAIFITVRRKRRRTQAEPSITNPPR